MGCHALLPRIFPTQGSNLGLLPFRKILYHLSHQGSPVEAKGVIFSRESESHPQVSLPWGQETKYKHWSLDVAGGGTACVVSWLVGNSRSLRCSAQGREAGYSQATRNRGQGAGQPEDLTQQPHFIKIETKAQRGP